MAYLMRSYRNRFALLVFSLGLLIGVPAQAPAMPCEEPRSLQGFLQPFLNAFHRYDHHVIVFLADHPDYEAVESMITYRAGQQPLIRAFITLRDGTQIDHSSDREFVRDRAALLTEREVLYRPIHFEVSEVDGVPRVQVRFRSYRGESIALDAAGLTPPSPDLGGLINPGGHGGDLAILWAEGSAPVSPGSVLTIDGVPFALGNPAFGGAAGFYSAGFQIGVFYDGHLELRPISAPRRVVVGERWVYRDNLGNRHTYEIVDIDGDQLTVHKTTTSPALTEEILTAGLVGGQLELRSVRATGRVGDELPIPPAPEGLTLDLSTPGGFSISLDEHADLVTGIASLTEQRARTVWTLQPVEPPWTASATVTATVTVRRGVYSIDSQTGER
ncbi:uncharacterized protein SOCEGT47_019380 [Sorangium cellulosum]|uniref:Secreted protein n=1 Tax=Sorangium cellulosum TaxID=56 RepID=A0A4P2PXB2_SORCE|nr:hypothetical protein [Sorangium cellulosum]AUX21454.1 uncharacterized protein SOCEGT47_019380 [Sorangium cellulosum]